MAPLPIQIQVLGDLATSALYNQELNQQLQWDIINNPYAYEKNIPSGNLFALLGLAIKLFERR